MPASAPFLLAFEGGVHSKAVRCACVVAAGASAASSSSSSASSSAAAPALAACEIVTGSLDSSIVVWRPQAPSGRGVDAPAGPPVYNPRLVLRPHADFVYCVAACETDKVIPSFFSGSKDKRALRLALDDGRVLTEFEGHEGPVCSLAEVAASSLFVTGSWDGTARLWRIATGECVRSLEQHKHAVAVLALPQPPLIVTGSQDKALRFWSLDGNIQRIVPDAHDDIIRALDALPRPSSAPSAAGEACIVLSASNDQRVKAWELNGSLLAQFEAHSAFVFDVKASRVRGDRFFTASDDSTCKVWMLSESPQETGALTAQVTQTLLHAATVWQVVELPSGDIVTCCEDGKMRVWTQDTARSLPEAERAQQESEARLAQEAAAAKRESAIDVSSLPDVSQMAAMRGKKDGEVKMFREGQMAVVYRWQQSTSSWEKLGEVMGAAKQKTYYEGDAYFEGGDYDYVFNVEIGEDGAYRRLPFRLTDNPLVAAEKFCARECINKSCLEQITSFIRRNAGLASSPPAAAPSAFNRGVTGSAQDSVYGAATAVTSSMSPLMEVFTFAKGNFEAAGKKILEFDAQFPPGAPEKLTELEKQYLLDALEKIKSPAFLKKEFRACEIEVIFEKLAKWPCSRAMPVMDVWRIMALHPQYHAVHKKAGDQGWTAVVVALRHTKDACNSAADDAPLILCCLRFLANLMDLTTSRSVMLRHAAAVLASLASDRILVSANRNVRLTAASVLANFAVAFANKEEKAARVQVIELLHRLMITEQDADVYYRCLAALLTILVTPPLPQQRATLVNRCKELDVASLLPPMNQQVPAEGKVGDMAQNLLLLLE
ncbi:PUL domain-containing protein [Besnoitia besnoiti]|uniref:PUL domain-containing protein n=1 Tax=Besnoitia besnoiti TaxID=94643 RepID=A0A2A9M8I3_BESBE|nr:PUL domain-containing protein [Besnoitia besnoiti]PFH32226.1 PUL domain-containing protein [Besnoitia besnoiti]